MNNTNLLTKIPYLFTPDIALKEDSQVRLPIAEIEEDLVLYKDGGAAIVLESTSLNFGLLSEKEQQAVIYAYASMLNSLSFSIQIVVRTQKKDITSYMNYLETEGKHITNPKMVVLMNSYKKFITESIKKKNVLGKKFYIVIPFSPLELGISKSLLSITKRSGPLPYPKSYVLKKARLALYPRRDHLIRQMGRLGLKTQPLGKDALVELYYSIFNPEKPHTKKEELVNG